MPSPRLPAAALLFLTVWEVSARIDDAWTDHAPLLGLYDQSQLLTSDEFGITGKPGAHFSKWQLNSLGFRGPELDPARARILCIGASETFGLYEPPGQEFPPQLERALSPRYQVVNAALPGQSLSSFARRATQVIRQVKPTLAVLYPSLAIYIDPPPENFAMQHPPVAPKFRFRIAGKLFALLSDHTPAPFRTALDRLQIQQQTGSQAVRDRISETNVDRFRRDLSRLLDILATERVQAVLVTHATRFGDSVIPADMPMLTAWRTLHPTLREAGFLDMEQRLNQVIRQEATTRNLILADATALLRGPADFVEYVHFTPAGSAKLARIIANEISRH